MSIRACALLAAAVPLAVLADGLCGGTVEVADGETFYLSGCRLPEAGLMEGRYVDMSKGDEAGQSIWCSRYDDIEAKVGADNWVRAPRGARKIFDGYDSVVSNGLRRATAYAYRGYVWNDSPTNETWQFALHVTYRMNLRVNGSWTPFGNRGEGACTNVWSTVLSPGPNPILVYSLSANWNERQEVSPRFDGLGLSYDRHPVAGQTNASHFARLDDGGTGRLLTTVDSRSFDPDTPAYTNIERLVVGRGATVDLCGHDVGVGELQGVPAFASVLATNVLAVSRRWTPGASAGGRTMAFPGVLRFGAGARVDVPACVSGGRFVLARARRVEGLPAATGGWGVCRAADADGDELLMLVRSGPSGASLVPAVSDAAFANPLKGFRMNVYEAGRNSYCGVVRDYLPWNALENDATDGVEKITAVCDARWASLNGTHVKIIPRVYLKINKTDEVGVFPADLTPMDWESPAFTNRLVRLIGRLGTCWDRNPRIAWIQMGLWGAWGEHHTPSIPAHIQRLMGDAFVRAFPNKKVLVRSGEDFTDCEFGYYWDSWAHAQQWEGKGQGSKSIREKVEAGRYLTQPIEGETAYDWGDIATQPGDSPDDTLSDPVHTDWLEMTIRKLHCTALGWVSRYNPTNDAIRAGAARIQKAFGYRYEVRKVAYDPIVAPGGTLSVSGAVCNVGSAPFYYRWPVSAALLRADTRTVAWQGDFDADIRTWTPGDVWDDSAKAYAVPAPDCPFGRTFALPADLPAGAYRLALGVRDPMDGAAAVRFAVEPVTTDGWNDLAEVIVSEAGPTVLADDLVVDVPAGETVTLDPAWVTETTVNIRKTGAGDLVASPIPGYAGDFTIDGGRFILNQNGDLGANNAGTCYVNDGATLCYCKNDQIARGETIVFAGRPAEGWLGKLVRLKIPADYKENWSYFSDAATKYFATDGDVTFASQGNRLQMFGTFDANGHDLIFDQRLGAAWATVQFNCGLKIVNARDVIIGFPYEIGSETTTTSVAAQLLTESGQFSLKSRDGGSRLVIRGNARNKNTMLRYTRNVTTDGQWTIVLQDATWSVVQPAGSSATVVHQWNGTYRKEGTLSKVVLGDGVDRILGPNGTTLYPRGFVFVLRGQTPSDPPPDPVFVLPARPAVVAPSAPPSGAQDVTTYSYGGFLGIGKFSPLVANDPSKASANASNLKAMISRIGTGGVLHFPAGTYYVGSRIDIGTGVTLWGVNAEIVRTGVSNRNSTAYADNATSGSDYNWASFAMITAGGVTIRGLTFRYDAPTCFTAEILSDKGDGSQRARLTDGREAQLDGAVRFQRINAFDAEGRPTDLDLVYSPGTTAGTNYKLASAFRTNATDGVTFALWLGKDKVRAGDRVTLCCSTAYSQGFVVGGTSTIEDVAFEDVTVANCFSMAMVVKNLRNLTLRRFRVKDATPGSLFAAGMDGVHVAGLAGKLTMEDCEFCGLADDMLNVHATAGVVGSVSGTTVTPSAIVEALSFAAGETVKFYTAKYEDLGTAKVKTVSGALTGITSFTVDAVPSGVVAGCLIGNETKMPEVAISGCWFGRTRARGILLQTDAKVVVRDSVFHDTRLAGMLLSPSATGTWCEMGPLRDVTVTNCWFKACGVGEASAANKNNGAVVVRCNHDADNGWSYDKAANRDIAVVGSRFKDCTSAGVFAANTTGLVVRGNSFWDCGGRVPAYDGSIVQLEYCGGATVMDNVSYASGFTNDVSSVVSTGVEAARNTLK